MQPRVISRAVYSYLTTTTLHGFKYLCAPFYADRVAWIISCLASGCCAGVLCGVLWTRFLQVPNVLSLQASQSDNPIPKIAICLPSNNVAENIVREFFGTKHTDLVKPISKILRGQPVTEYHLASIDQLLHTKNVTWAEAVSRSTLNCSMIVDRCRLNNDFEDCNEFTRTEMTNRGTCCVINSNRFEPLLGTNINSMEVALNYSNVHQNFGYIVSSSQSHRQEINRMNGENDNQAKIIRQKCGNFLNFNDIPVDNGVLQSEMLILMEGRGWVKVSQLLPGNIYRTTLSHVSILPGEIDGMADFICKSDLLYSRENCLKICIEQSCGCSDPFQRRSILLPVCSLTKLNCLRNKEIEGQCDCMYSCQRTTTYTSTDQSKMDALQHCIDPFYMGLNSSISLVLSVNLRKSGSQVFTRMPTETWLTLLSSLGGVFNMFLGVGLFSALELIYFLFIRMPIAIRRSIEMHVVSAATTSSLHNDPLS